MTNFRARTVSLLSLLGLAACSAQTAPSPGEPASSAPRASEGARQIEAAQRSLDVGKVLPGSAETLAQLAKNGTDDERDDAALALSRTYDLQGKKELAIRTLEDLLARHHDDTRWARQDDVDAKLVELVTGKPAPKRPDVVDRREPVSRFAQALAPSFHPDAQGAYELDILQIGGSDSVSSRFGTFRIGEAIRDADESKCPLCEHHLSIHTHRSRVRSWTSIPMYRDDLDTSLAVFYYDQTVNRIPARYERYLPLSVSEIESKLANGQGLVAVEQRDAAPPVVLIAAPRYGQLGDVEEALANMNELPAEPVSVPLAAGLRHDEIQAVVRGARKHYKACYDALLGHSADAAGKVTLSFAIDAEGAVQDTRAEASAPSLEDATFISCFESATSALKFPATHGKTTVKYPIELSP